MGLGGEVRRQHRLASHRRVIVIEHCQQPEHIGVSFSFLIHQMKKEERKQATNQFRKRTGR
jgi:hypothetical protein